MKTSELLTIAAAIVPERDAVVFEGRRYTYEQINERVNRLANALTALGVQRADRVGIIQVNCNQFLESYYAASRMGAMFVPLNYRAKGDELAYMLNSAETSVLLVGDRYVPLIDGLRAQLPGVKHCISLEKPQPGMLFYEDLLASASADENDVDVDEAETTILMYTAGTTGFPKGVLLPHQSFTMYVLGNVNSADPDVHQVSLIAIPLYHIAGMQAIMSNVYAGRTIVMLRQFEAGEFLKMVTAERVTHSILVPTMLKQVIDHPDFAKCDLRSLQQITYGAAPMPFEVIKKAVEVMPNVRFMNAFGQTETASTITVLGPEDHDISGTPEEKEKKLKRLATSIGRPMDDVEMKIADEAGKDLKPGEVGEIVARGPRVMSGYWKSPEATAAAIKDGWVHTGDMGWMDDENYFYLAGRKKDMIIRGGENISPEEVEGVLQSHPAVEEAAVIGVPDKEWGEVVRAIVALKPGASASDSEIIEYCRQRLSSFKKPESVVFVEALPRNQLGKVLKTTLREQYGGP